MLVLATLASLGLTFECGQADLRALRQMVSSNKWHSAEPCLRHFAATARPNQMPVRRRNSVIWAVRVSVQRLAELHAELAGRFHGIPLSA